MSGRVGVPPSSDTGASLTAGIDYLRGTTKEYTVEDTVSFVADLVGESVEIQDGGLSGYTRSFWVGPVRVMDNPARPDMGVNVLCSGEGCEVLGLERVARLYLTLCLKASRLDIKADNCGFTPGMLRDEWMRDNVRTRAQKPNPEVWAKLGKRIKPGMEQVRSCDWHAGMSGDTFDMGARESEQCARCYDSRGFTRFELELKGRKADRAAALLLGCVAEGALVSFGVLALGLVRNFVDFVDVTSDANLNRCDLLPWWAEFCAGIERVKLTLHGKVSRALEDVQEWLENQVSSSVALVYQAFGVDAFWRLLSAGEGRLKQRHVRMLRDYRRRMAAADSRVASWRSLEGQIGVCT